MLRGTIKRTRCKNRNSLNLHEHISEPKKQETPENLDNTSHLTWPIVYRTSNVTIVLEVEWTKLNQINLDKTQANYRRSGSSNIASMCWRTEGTFITARRCCGVFVILAPDTKLQTYLLPYFDRWLCMLLCFEMRATQWQLRTKIETKFRIFSTCLLDIVFRTWFYTRGSAKFY